MAEVVAAPSAVVATGLRKRFPVHTLNPWRPRVFIDALVGADLDVPARSIHGVIGPNGSGKSTLLRLLATLVLPDAGSASVAGHDAVADADGVRRSIGFSTGEERSLYWRLTARQNLEFAAALHGIDRRSPAIGAALQQAKLTDAADRPVSGFSQGMARRLGLARAMLHEPSVLLLDEPARSLDPVARDDFHEVLRRLCVDHGTTVLLTTHDLGEAVDVCDEVSVLHGGRIVERLAPEGEGELRAALERAAS